MAKATYKSAGLDLDLYNEGISRLPRLMQRTFTPRVLPLEDGFAGLFRLDFDCPLFARKYEDPVLVSCTDGVGTKLKVAQKVGRHDTVGIDLVAMSINDALCLGAEPLFFLDYLAMNKDDPNLLEQLVRGVSNGCVEADCALIGGETAIMPDVYAPGDYDLAGFCVGVVDRKKLIDGKHIAAGDALIGVASSGLHSNGYSLVRKVVFELEKFEVNQHVEELGETVGDCLLTPTRIYSKAVRRILGHYKVKQVVHGLAHITGGGIKENLERIMPLDVRAVIDRNSWRVPPVFPWLQRLGEIDEAEMERVFNMGIGLIVVAAPFYASSILDSLHDQGYDAWEIGRVEAGPREVVWAEK